MAKTKGIFVREASGLVRSMPPFDAWVYNVMSAGILPGFALMFSLIPFTYPNSDYYQAVVLAAVGCFFINGAYAFLSTTLPRSGGEYVFASRGLGGAVGFTAVFGGYTFASFFFCALSGWAVATMGISPMVTLLGFVSGISSLVNLGTWLSAGWGVFVVATLLNIVVWAILYFGMRIYVRIQRWLFAFTILATVIIAGMLLVSSHADFVARLNSFANPAYTNSTDYYSYVINTAKSLGYSTGTGTNLTSTLYAIPILYYVFFGTIWGTQTLGDIKHAESVKHMFAVYEGGIVFITAIFLGVGFLLFSTIGYQYIASIGFLYFTAPQYMGSGALTIPPYFGYLPQVLFLNPITITLIGIGFITSLVQWVANSYIGPTRDMLAMSFDRALPEPVSNVNLRWRSTYVANTVMLVGSEILLIWGLVYTNFGSIALTGIFMQGVVVATAMLSAIVIPFRRKEIYRKGAASKYTVGGIPLMSIMGMVGFVFILWILVRYLSDAAYGVVDIYHLSWVSSFLPSELLLVVAFLGSAVFYFVWQWRQRRRGIDISLAFQEIPPE